METNMTFGPVEGKNRVFILDVLRGLALLGILMVNMPVFNTPFILVIGEGRMWTDPLNKTAFWILDYFFHGKFYALFSFLFGMGFYFFLKKVDEAGKTMLTIFRRRLFVLLIIGVLHVVLLWYGDILVVYALFGFILTWFRNKSDRTVLIWAGVFLLIPLVFTTLMLSVVNLAMSSPEAASKLEQTFSGQQAYFDQLAERAMVVYSTGSFSEIISMRLTEYSYIWGGILSFFPFVLAMFLVGMLFGRRGYLADIKANEGFFRKLFWINLPLAIMFNYLLATNASVAQHAFPSGELVLMMLGFAIGGPSMMFVYLSLVVFCLNRGYLQWLASKIAGAGRMALTNYLTQSIICTTIYYGYGLGMYGRVGIVNGMLLTLAIYIVQLIWSHYWLQYFRFGPFEWAWRSLTYRRLQPLKK